MGARWVILILVLMWPTTLAAQDFRLSECRVLVSDGSLVKLKCADATYWVVGRDAAARCASWSQTCPMWEHRSGLLDQALATLDKGKALLEECTTAGDQLNAQVLELAVQNEDLQASINSRWTTLEVLGVVSMGTLGGLLAGFLVGAFAL
jgi:hypothetical protein